MVLSSFLLSVHLPADQRDCFWGKHYIFSHFYYTSRESGPLKHSGSSSKGIKRQNPALAAAVCRWGERHPVTHSCSWVINNSSQRQRRWEEAAREHVLFYLAAHSQLRGHRTARLWQHLSFPQRILWRTTYRLPGQRWQQCE